MLVLSRNNSESILIGENIEVVLLQSRNGRARIGIRAPKECQIVRPENLEKTPAVEGRVSVKGGAAS